MASLRTVRAMSLKTDHLQLMAEHRHAEYVFAVSEGRTRTLRDIRDHEGVRGQREGDVYPLSLTPDTRLLLTHEQRFRRVVRALDAAGYEPSIKNLLICVFRAPLGEVRRSGGWTLNGRECKWRAEELTRLGYTKSGANGRWVK